MKNIMFLIKSFVQMIFEELYIFILNVIKQNIGNLGILYFPTVFDIFYFIYFINIRCYIFVVKTWVQIPLA